MKLRSSLIFLILLFLPACTTPPKADEAARDQERATAEAQLPQEPTGEDCELLFQDRLHQDKTVAAIQCWEDALQESADEEKQAQFHGDLSSAHYFLARYHLALQEQPEREAVAAHAKDAEANALQALAILDPPIYKTLNQDQPMDELLTDLKPEAADELLNYARSLQLWAEYTSLAAQVAYERRVDAIMNFIADKYPETAQGAAPRYLGVRWIERPLHKNPARSAEHFNRSLNVAPDFLITRYLRARYLATATKDRALFESDLQAILDAEEDQIPENFFATELARELLELADELF